MTKSCGCIGRSIGAENPHWLGYGGISLTKWNSLKKDAIKNRKIPFNISIEYAWELFLKQNRKCALTGLDITFSQTKRTSKMQCSASLDRIDSFLPYEEGNVQWVDKRVNFMKQRFPQDEFQRLCFLVSKHAGLVK